MCLLQMAVETIGRITVRTKEEIKITKKKYLLAKPRKLDKIRHSINIKDVIF